MNRCLHLTCLLLLAVGLRVSAQPLSNLVFTVGTTHHGGGAERSYVLMGTPQPHVLAGKRFAVYGKAGHPTNAGTFTLRGTLFQQTEVGPVNTLLGQSLPLGQDVISLSNALNVLFHDVPGISSQSLAQKILTGFEQANRNPETAHTLRLLARVHPGLSLCLGQAFTEQITTVTTYELREIDPGTGLHGDVVCPRPVRLSRLWPMIRVITCGCACVGERRLSGGESRYSDRASTCGEYRVPRPSRPGFI
jgi:hypothetical protein